MAKRARKAGGSTPLEPRAAATRTEPDSTTTAVAPTTRGSSPSSPRSSPYRSEGRPSMARAPLPEDVDGRISPEPAPPSLVTAASAPTSNPATIPHTSCEFSPHPPPALSPPAPACATGKERLAPVAARDYTLFLRRPQRGTPPPPRPPPPPPPAPDTHYLLRTKDAFSAYFRVFLRQWAGVPVLPLPSPPPPPASPSHPSPHAPSLIATGVLRDHVRGGPRCLSHLELLYVARQQWSHLSRRRRRPYFRLGPSYREGRGGVHPSSRRVAAEASRLARAHAAFQARENAPPWAGPEGLPLAPKVKSLAAWEMRRGRVPVEEAHARIGRMTEGERRRGRQAVRDEKEEYDRAVERFCARHGRGGIEEGMEGSRGRGAREEEGEVGQEERGGELREDEEEEGGVGGKTRRRRTTRTMMTSLWVCF
ncbi:hypothetical protein NSK_003670 [Nannochloropsis salina CCMP1776]|uniref:Uncharacterized protein n=1 Tax=Nannochloropsis salina CCMP1776 TaxID=1027361 RepID=A0A4D9D4D3_9STRA|nr:hypothetical protein NSK_003670 [Nannochloropsis salina CCMP1776]|eukprot:TFJ85247.1 hypothetical protein NSK_003670 [Nannochloropsis salina CCMP1776]